MVRSGVRGEREGRADMSDVGQQSDPRSERPAIRATRNQTDPLAPPAGRRRHYLFSGFLRRNGYRNRCEFSSKAKVGQALEQTFCLLLLRTAVEVVRAEVLVLSAML